MRTCLAGVRAEPFSPEALEWLALVAWLAERVEGRVAAKDWQRKFTNGCFAVPRLPVLKLGRRCLAQIEPLRAIAPATLTTPDVACLSCNRSC
jgi:hypothetical protein